MEVVSQDSKGTPNAYINTIEIIDDEMNRFDDIHSAAVLYREQRRHSEGFYKLMNAAAATGLYMEQRTVSGRYVDDSIQSAKAYTNGVLFAEQVNEAMYATFPRSAPYFWMTTLLNEGLTERPDLYEMQVEDAVKLQIGEVSEAFLNELPRRAVSTLAKWSCAATAYPDARPFFMLGCGFHLSSAFQYYHYHRGRGIEGNAG